MHPLNKHTWWQHLDPNPQPLLRQIWIPIGVPGHDGAKKETRQALLDARFGADCWRISYYVRGRIVSKSEAIREYEQSYRLHLHQHPEMVDFLVTTCGNVYDDNVSNVYDQSYEQPHTHLNHYQDIAVRRVIAELVEDVTWPGVSETPVETVALTDLNDGQEHSLPRARGFRGSYLLQLREPDTPGFFLNPAVVPVHDPSLIISSPLLTSEWYLAEGCQHLSVEAFWQMSKVIEVRYDKFLALGPTRNDPLDGLD
jgi:hypothetical protein